MVKYKILGSKVYYGKNYFYEELLKFYRYGYYYIYINKKFVERIKRFNYKFNIKVGDKILLKTFDELKDIYENRDSKMLKECKKHLGRIVTVKETYKTSFAVKESKEYEFFNYEIEDILKV